MRATDYSIGEQQCQDWRLLICICIYYPITIFAILKDDTVAQIPDTCNLVKMLLNMADSTSEKHSVTSYNRGENTVEMAR